MARHSPLRFEESFTFRLEPEMKAALTQAAARRQCLAVNALAQNPASDEASVMAELDAHFESDEYRDEWKA